MVHHITSIFIAVSIVVAGFMVKHTSDKDIYSSFGYSIKELKGMKKECEEQLPRNKECVIKFKVEDE